MGFPPGLSVQCGGGPLGIFSFRDGLKVFRVDAGAIAAEVIQFASCWDGADEEAVCCTMSECRFIV